MAFDQSPITGAEQVQSRGQLHLSWTSTAPSGSWYQVYVGRKLAWYGLATTATVPTPPYRSQVDIGVVAATERAVDFSASLPAPPSDRATLSWQGGTFLDADLAGFRVYGPSGFGSGGFGSGGYGMGVDPLGVVPAYTPAVYTDGYGMGGFGDGGFGSAAGSYRWRSGSLANGPWSFAVTPFDSAGNEGTPEILSATIAAPPNPPARNAAGKRLTISYNATTKVATLAWLASPE